jgi:hypothetical protein
MYICFVAFLGVIYFIIWLFTKDQPKKVISPWICPSCGREYSESNRVQYDPISGEQMCDICFNDLMNRRIMFEILAGK